MPATGFQGIKRLLEQTRNVGNAANQKSAVDQIEPVRAKGPAIRSLVNIARLFRLDCLLFGWR
jgi:hypothetical protein